MAESMQPKSYQGRPLKFKSVEELQKKIESYFRKCDPHWITEVYWYYPMMETLSKKGNVVQVPDYSLDPIKGKRKVLTEQKPYTITGLAVALDTTRDTLIDYESGRRDGVDADNYDPKGDYFSDTVKKAKMKVHEFNESRLHGPNATGPIFSLKNNFKWKDQTEVENTGTVTIVTRGAGTSAADD